MRDIPWSEIAKWPKPNYVNPQGRGNELVIFEIVGLVIATIIVGLRIFTRICVKRWFGFDDAFVILAWAGAVGLAVTVALPSSKAGWNLHIWDVPIPTVKWALQMSFITKLQYVLASTFLRLSLLCFYYRLVRDAGNKSWVYAIHGSIATVVLSAIILLCGGIWQCKPIYAYWTWPKRHGHTCTDEGAWMIAGGVVMATVDFLVTLLPIPLVARLNMPARQRMGVIILFCLGFIASIVSVVKIYYVWYMFYRTYDQSWAAYPLLLLSALEIDIGIICACVPPLKPLMAPWLSKSFSSIRRSARSLTGSRSASNQERSNNRNSIKLEDQTPSDSNAQTISTKTVISTESDAADPEMNPRDWRPPTSWERVERNELTFLSSSYSRVESDDGRTI